MTDVNARDILDGIDADEFRSRLHAASSTPPEQRGRCPECDSPNYSVRVSARTGETFHGNPGFGKEAPAYRCRNCRHRFETPRIRADDGSEEGRV